MSLRRGWKTDASENRCRVARFILGNELVPQAVRQSIISVVEDIVQDSQDIGFNFCANTEGASTIPCASP